MAGHAGRAPAWIQQPCHDLPVFQPRMSDNDGDGMCNDEDACPNQPTDALGVCGGTCMSDLNGNGICDDVDVLGCTYESATNFNLPPRQTTTRASSTPSTGPPASATWT